MKCTISARNKKKAAALMILTAVLIGLISLVDGVVQPPYAVKSAIKVALFFVCPLLYTRIDRDLNLKSLFRLDVSGRALREGFLWGAAVFSAILIAYFILGKYFDLSQITDNMTEKMGIDADNFIYVAVYISFANSFLEEFFFRGFAFLKLKNYVSRSVAYCFSASVFALYHVAMMSVAFRLDLLLLALLGLVIGGCLFNYFNEKYGNLYISWLIHMGANFAINIIGCFLFGIL